MANLTPQALRVMQERYLAPGETPEQRFRAVAEAVAEAEPEHGHILADQYFDMMNELRFLPNSPTLMNAGKGNGLQLAACYVLPVEDSLDEIFESVKQAAIIHKSGGGTGFSFSRLRPAGSRVGTTNGVSSGPVSFLRVFDAATEAIKQGGTRRGANMGILNVDHPDIEEFIDCKLDGGITNFNISVGVTNAFMDAVERDASWPLRDPATGAVVRSVRAADLWNKLVNSAWASGDPGIIFLDHVNVGHANPDTRRKVEATNPCGEVPLYPYEACNLGSINLAKFVVDGHVDLVGIRSTANLAARFLDGVVTVNPYPLDIIRENVLDYRRIGLGVMGWADMLSMLEIPYDSDEARGLAGRIAAAIRGEAEAMSRALATKYGPFRAFNHSIYADEPPLRNATLTTIAPTGTISIIAGCSSGIEPHFALAYSHEAPGQDRKLAFMNPVLSASLYTVDWNAVSRKGTGEGYPWHKYYLTAHEIDPRDHVLMQAAWQQFTDNAVSKTINLRHDATVDDVASAYLDAYTHGCLGITVFRDGCKGYDKQVLHAGNEATPVLRERGAILNGQTVRIVAPEGKVNVTVNSDKEGPLEVFVNVGKAGSDISALAEATGRLCSLVLRIPSSMPVEERMRELIHQLSDIGGSRTVGFGPNQVRSMPDAVARALRIMVDASDAAVAQPVQHAVSGNMCPECHNLTLHNIEGCKKCEVCGYSEC